MPDGRVQLSDLEPARAIAGTAVPVPGSSISVTLLDHRYGRGRTEGGRPIVIKWAKLRFSSADRTHSERFDLDETHDVLGRRLYITGSRSEVLVYALPEQTFPSAGPSPE